MEAALYNKAPAEDVKKPDESSASNKTGEKASVENGIKEGEEILKILNNGGAGAPPITLGEDDWQKVGHIKTSNREYDVETVHSEWQVIKSGDGATILPIVERGGKKYIVLEYKPEPSIGRWELELPAGGKDKGEDSETTARRELEEETGYKATNLELFMHDMHFMPSRFEQREDVYIATGLTEGYRHLEYEEQPIKVCVFPEDLVEVLLKQNKITDFRTVAVLSQYFLREHEKKGLSFLLRGDN
jgi:ADP-ribose pyrophosphatase